MKAVLDVAKSKGFRDGENPVTTIREADEAMLWLRWLEVDDAKLVWTRANGKAWKPICWQFGLSRTAATRRWQYGLAVIVWRLNGRVPPMRRSMDFVIKRARTDLPI